MPLLKGRSKRVIAENIRREIHAGRSQQQAIAIAFSKAGLSYKGKKKMARRKHRRRKLKMTKAAKAARRRYRAHKRHGKRRRRHRRHR